MAFGRPPRWPTFTALAIALMALAVGLVGWFRPVPPTSQPSSKPAYTDQQVANAKTNICAAFEKVHNAVDLAHTHVGSTDYNTQLTAAALTNLALDAGSRYLLTKLAEEPATPPDLATAVRNEANAEQEALIGYLNGLPASDPQMQPAVSASDDATATVRRLCK
jgi:ABC-type glycerol-3-phosphate transport system substrate-binding protein